MNELFSLTQLAGTLVYAKREFLNHQKYSAAEGGDSESALLRSGSGVADARILAAYQVMADTKVPITPAKLATRAVTGYPTALRWLKIHHPELLVSKPDEASVASVLAPEPKPILGDQRKTRMLNRPVIAAPEISSVSLVLGSITTRALLQNRVVTLSGNFGFPFACAMIISPNQPSRLIDLEMPI